METRRSTRLSAKVVAKPKQAFKTSEKNSVVDQRDGSASPVPSKKTKSSYFDPDFSEHSDSAPDTSEHSDSAPESPPQKRKIQKKTVNAKKKPLRKSKNNYHSDSESSSNEFVTKRMSVTKILESKTELKLSSDESDSSVESPPKRIKKSDGSPGKKKPSQIQDKIDSESSSEEFVAKPSFKSNDTCKSEPLEDNQTLNDEEKSDNKAEYFDFTALVNKVKANVEMAETEKKEPEIEVKKEPEKEPSKSKPTKRPKKAAAKPENKLEQKSDLEVFELLAMGEDTDMSAKDIKESVSQNSKQNYEIPKQVEVLLDAPILKKKKPTDLEMTLRRRLNFIRRENQVYVHKVHVLCLIAHGRYINSVLNSPELLCQALSLLPSDKCYPPKRMDMNYLNQLIEWFAKKIKVKKDPVENKKIKLSLSLQTQFQNMEADNKTDLCFLFVCIIRALGIKCRLIINLNVVPLKPTSDQLLTVNVKKDPSATPTSTKETSTSKKSSEKSTSDDKKSKQTPKKDVKESSSRSRSSTGKSKNPETPTKESSSRSQSDTRKEKDTPSKQSTSRSDETKEKATSNKERSSRSRSDKANEKQTPTKDPPSRSRSEKSETPARSSRSRTEKSKTQETPKDDVDKRSSRSKESKKSQETPPEPSRRSARSKSTNSKQKSEYFVEEKTSRRSERVTNSKSGYFPKETTEESKSARGKSSSKSSNSKLGKNSKKSEPEDLVEEMSTSDDSEGDADDTFVPVKKKKKIDRRVLSSEEDVKVEEKPDPKNKPNKSNYWIEVFLEAEEQWICVDVAKKSYHCIQQLYNSASHPIRYIVAFNSDQTIKDVTRRYVPQYLSVTRKLRVDDAWWKSTLHPFKPTQNAQELEEDEALDRVLEEQPLPTAISEYKNHPLYALKRHLLKFQGIYPPDAPPLGFVKGEPVYSRLCVHQLHGREMWIKEAKVVKMGEKPYKIVKGRQKKDKFGTDEGPKDLELFGLWQTEDYDPPVAENGIVPRNSFGNVELFKMCMLPKGTVYLQIPGLQRIANKLNIDCAAAITGFEYSTNGWSYPVKDGFVVCEEFKDILLDAYNQEAEEAEKKEKQKREERVYANWKRLIKGLFIREKLKRKYNFGDPGTSSEQEEKTKSK